MLKNEDFLRTKTALVLLIFIFVSRMAAAAADRPGWKRQEVDWRITGGSRIKAINYPHDKQPPLLGKRTGRRKPVMTKNTIRTKAASDLSPLAQETTISIVAYVIDSPPIDGFVPWIAVSPTDARSTDDDFYADDIDYLVGNYLTTYPQLDYAIGIYDTGAAANIMGYADADRAGVFAKNLDGPLPDAPDLPTAIGSPMSVYYAAHFQVDQQITVTHNSQDFTGPQITFYPWYDMGIPTYSNKVTLELRPPGGVVAYWPYIDPETFEFVPMIPSVIIGDSMQSLFFFPEVDLTEGNKSAPAQDEFMYDTGAQVTVIGSTLAARLGLNDPNFYVEIIDITGEITIVPGFYIDSIEIPALGQWLSFTNVPVVMLDVASVEGGFLDGIIGMNLFTEYNFVINGGGFDLQTPPYIKFEPIPYHIPADIAPSGGDGKVDYPDLADFAQAYLAIPTSPNWNSKADLVSDAIINLFDFAILGEYWGQELAP